MQWSFIRFASAASVLTVAAATKVVHDASKGVHEPPYPGDNFELHNRSAPATFRDIDASMRASPALLALSVSPAPPDSMRASDLDELISFFTDARLQGMEGLNAWKTARKPQCKSSQKTVFLPTVPRSGNTWARLALEEASGVATWAVFHPEPCTFAKVCPCGFSKDCDHVHSVDRKEEMNLVKLHHPFYKYGPLPQLNPPVERAILTVRNPFDNFIAWSKLPVDKKMSFPEFMSAWTSHFLFWIRKSQHECMQITMVRFEDMVDKQEPVLSVIQDAVRWKSFNVSRALALYPADAGFVSGHLYTHPEKAPLALKSAAKGLGEQQKHLMELLGYGDFITKLSM
eukprot:TRINITY_DN13141_c0_g1_i1.p1 TRINITY_DN13141_c0_g1~~TRINITY_DN13141_c0_g1_i1.p1  ORF type:complete len:343 (-),score=65.31 TRINITY_DN13141_c0_g1_i1:23-1051(-)